MLKTAAIAVILFRCSAQELLHRPEAKSEKKHEKSIRTDIKDKASPCSVPQHTRFPQPHSAHPRRQIFGKPLKNPRKIILRWKAQDKNKIADAEAEDLYLRALHRDTAFHAVFLLMKQQKSSDAKPTFPIS